jgi:hypothetical protein
MCAYTRDPFGAKLYYRILSAYGGSETRKVFGILRDPLQLRQSLNANDELSLDADGM